VEGRGVEADDRLNIILSPHFDDAVLSLGGCIAKSPERAVIVTVFAGTPPDGVAGRWDRWCGFASAADAMRARCRENEAALAVLGVPPSRICNLGHLDGQYRRRQPAGGTPADLRSAIAEDIFQLVKRYGGRVNLLAPASAWHPDHQIVTDAALDLCKGGGYSDAELFLYQDQPYAYLELRRTSRIPLRFASFARLAEIARKRLDLSPEARLLSLEEAHIRKKKRALKQYKSQFPLIKHLLYKMIADFSFYQARDAGSAARYVEAVYRLAAPPPVHS
jgi:LmbE family N-acetylglucosaminyl deacetylase